VRAHLITFEGVEGSGKTTQARRLYRRLLGTGAPALLTYEPGGTPLGSRVRALLKQQTTPVSPLAELMLFAASRAQLVSEVIRPALERNVTVVCDRYADSTVAYQGYGRGIDLKTIRVTNAAVVQGIIPSLTILLDVPAEAGLRRKKNTYGDRFEQEELTFHLKIKEGYLRLAAAEPDRWLVIDGTLPVNEIGRRIWDRVRLLPGLVDPGVR